MIAAAYNDDFSEIRLLPGPNEDDIATMAVDMLTDAEVMLQQLFNDTLLPDIARSMSSEADNALHRAGFHTASINCSRGIVSVNRMSYRFPPRPIDNSWNLHVECCFNGGKVTKTGRGSVKPLMESVILQVPGIVKMKLWNPTSQYPLAVLHYARPTLKDTRPVVRAFRRVIMHLFEGTVFDTSQEDCPPWAQRLWN